MHRERLYLEDIRDACLRIGRYLDGQTFESFASQELVFDATVRNLQNIGEAVRALPEDVRALRPEIEWTRIVGLRNLLVHHYIGVDEEIVWDLATNRCPELRIAVENMLSQLPD